MPTKSGIMCLYDGEAERLHTRAKGLYIPSLPLPLLETLKQKLKQALYSLLTDLFRKGENANSKMFSRETVAKIRRAFFDIQIELFSKYKAHSYVDFQGEVQFDIKRFITSSNKKYK